MVTHMELIVAKFICVRVKGGGVKMGGVGGVQDR